MTERRPAGATRREIMALGAAGSAMLVPPFAAAAAAPGLDTPEAWLRAYMLMRGALDERLVIGFVSGMYYGVVDQEITPMYGVVAATFSRYRALPDGTYMGVSTEVPYFVDLETGKVLDSFRNPYTGETVKVVHGGYPPARLIVGKDMRIHVPTPVPGLTLDDEIVGREVIGNDVYVAQQTRSVFQPSGMPKPVRYSEVVTVQADRAALLKRSAKSVPARTSYTSIVSWRPWLNMGERPGNLIGIGHGGYGATMESLPKRWRDGVAERRPDVLKNPAALLPAL